MTRPLFREEALRNKTRKFHGAILLTHTWSHTIFATFLCVIVACLILFACLFSFARKATATGVVLPSKGINRVVAPQSGTIARIHATEGQVVRVGDPLITISSDRTDEDGGIQGAVKDSLIARIDKLARELNQQGSQINNRQREVDEKLMSLDATMRHLDRELDLQRNKVRIARDIAGRVAELAKSGNISKIAAAEKEAHLLEQESRLASLEVQRQGVLRDITSHRSARADGPLQGKRDASSIQRQIEDLKQQLAENEAKRRIIVRAEVDGRVAAVLAEPGQAISANQRISSIIPTDSQLEVELLMPSRNVGMVNSGTPVTIRYDAFPYQKFGQYKGTVRNVSETAISPADLVALGGHVTATPNAEAVFRVRVRLEKDEISVGGKRYLLKPGMQLTANVLLEERTIAAWMFEPLLGIAARN